MVRPRVFFDMAIGPQPAGRITIELFTDKTPETCKNFRLLCTGEKGQARTPMGNQDLCYKNSTFHRVIAEFMIQGGDITHGDGTGGASTLEGAKMFEDENLGWRKIDAEGLVCMANRGKGTNSSQFFITLADCDYLTGKHTLFGHVVSGMDVVKKIEGLPVDTSDHPLDTVYVENCGELLFKKKEPTSVTSNTHIKTDWDRPRPSSESRDRKKDRESSRRYHRKHSRSRNRNKDNAANSSNGAQEKDLEVTAQKNDRGRSRERRTTGPIGASIPEEPEEPLSSPPKRVPSKSRSRHRHRRRRYHSRSRSPERKHHRRGKSGSRSKQKIYDYYTRDEEAEEKIRKEEEEREMGRFAKMEETTMGKGRDGSGREPEVKFKGRGSMKYREKKSWGWGGGEGRLV